MNTHPRFSDDKYQAAERRAALMEYSDDSALVAANARTLANLVDNFRTEALRLINDTANLCNHVDADDEMSALTDRLQDFAGESFGNWNDYADRMRREA